MGNDQPALRAPFAWESGLSEPEIGLEYVFIDFILLIWQMIKAWQMVEMAKFARRDTADFPDVENGVVVFFSSIKNIVRAKFKS